MTVSLTAIVPVYNEEKFLEKSVENLLKIKTINSIFIVDDCSTDNSPNILNNLTKKDQRISLFKTTTNSGKGFAINSVKDSIKTDYVIIHDADLEYYPEDIELMLESINKEKLNLVLGSRFRKDNKKQIYYRTYFANKFLSLIFSLIYFSKFTDIATCYKLMPAQYFKNTAFEESGFAIEVELIAKFLKQNKNFLEVPISYTARSYEDGKKIKFIDGLKYLIAMIRYRF
tara:strand:- start:1064 stop:1750 length:687 start_codon:yes stop_codon:yes gene_type:complete